MQLHELQALLPALTLLCRMFPLLLNGRSRSSACALLSRYSAFFAVLLIAVSSAAEMDAARAKNLIVLDEVSVQNLQLETVTADEQKFEQVLFALGRVEPVPGARAFVSSTASGRIVEVKVAPGDTVEAGAEVVRLENQESGGGSSVISLTAPISGMVTAVHVHQGESVWRIHKLLEITNLREVDVIARIPEHEAALLQVGTRTRLRVPAACDKEFRSQLVRFGTEADRKHGTVEAFFRLKNSDLLMRPGMRAEFRISAAERPNVTAVPREAVQGNATQRFVFIKDYELPHAFVRVPVAIGQRNDRFVEITHGLMPGDEVVTTGAYALSSAGRGTVSLKAALDAAHGHEHHEDGTPVGEVHAHEKEGEQRTYSSRASVSGFTPLATFFASFSFLLLGLLYLSRSRDRNLPH